MHSVIENKLVLMLCSVALVTVVATLTLFQLRFYLTGPVLEIENEYVESTTNIFPVRAVVKNTQSVLVNNREVIPEFDGKLKIDIPLSVGLNPVQFDLFDKYGSHKQAYLYITYPQ